jgi:hypothetical protein
MARLTLLLLLAGCASPTAPVLDVPEAVDVRPWIPAPQEVAP